MKYSFNCYGHKNITSKHKTTIEFTKDEELGLEGDCIVGVKADFDLKKIKQFINNKTSNKVTIIIKSILNNKNDINKNKINNNKIVEKIKAEINPGFDSDKDIVIRKSDFIDERTFAIKADKAACDLDKKLVKSMSGGKISVCILD